MARPRYALAMPRTPDFHWRRACALAVALAAAQAQVGAAPAAPATGSAPPGAPAPAPVAPRDLFRTLLTRSYWLSPNGHYLLEIAIADKGDADRLGSVRSSEDLAKLQLPDQRIYLTDLKTMRYVEVSKPRAGVWVSDVRWLDGDSFVWHSLDRRRGRRTIEAYDVSVDAAGDVALGALRVLGEDAYLLEAPPGAEGRVLVVHLDEQGETVYRVDPRQALFVQMTPANAVAGPFQGVQRWVFDDAGEVRAVGLWRGVDELRVLVRTARGVPWRRCATLPATDLDTTDLVGIDARGALLVITNHGSDKRVLRELDPATGALGPVLIGDARNDVAQALRDPRDGRVVGAALNDDETRTRFIDRSVERLQAEVEKLMPRGRPRLLSYSADRQHTISFSGGPDDPGRYHYVSLAKQKAFLIETAAPWLEGKRLVRSEPIELKARDGLTIYGQFTRPLGAPVKPPLVVMPHGGPFGIRDYLRYDPEVQFLATRGYAVLQVDFRGSGGYGREFQQAGFRRWGAEMQDDLIDALDWVAARGWIDAGRVCAFGGSYGGYAAMMGVIQHPERFRCAVTYAGVSDLTLLFRTEEWRDFPFAEGDALEYLRQAVGDPDKEREALRARSPAYIAKGIRRPVFIAHGDADVRAEPEHAWRLRAEIEDGGGKVEWFMAKGEGHGFRLMENIDAFYGQLERFLGEQLAVQAPPAAAR